MVGGSKSAVAYAGNRVRITTIAPTQTTIEGTVYTADPVTNLLVLNTSATTATSITSSSLVAPPGSYRIVPISQISGFQLLSLPQASSEPPPNPALNAIDTNAVQARLAKNIAAQQSAQARVGPKGTSPTDQALFDSLSRTHPTRWSGNVMIISDTFMIEKPYEAANVRHIEGQNVGDLERMKKVIDMERSKIKLRDAKGSLDRGRLGVDASPAKGAPNAGMKKGG
jgi:protein LSM12